MTHLSSSTSILKDLLEAVEAAEDRLPKRRDCWWRCISCLRSFQATANASAASPSEISADCDSPAWSARTYSIVQWVCH
jgi:hypothetical protein